MAKIGFKHFINPIETVKKITSYYVKEGQTVVDCTVGNGNDILMLTKLIGEKGRAYGFDIQPLAINTTKDLLAKYELEKRAILIQDGHENIDKYIKEKINLVIYNLGYLPKGDKSIKTNFLTTLESIKKALTLLDNNGILLITCYTGHEGGLIEKEEVESYLKSLDQKKYNVIEFNFINQKNNPPILYGVEKL